MRCAQHARLPNEWQRSRQNMAQFRIAVIPGDGIGNEVVPEGIKVLERIAETSGGQISFVFESFPWGSAYYQQHGRMMAENALSVLQRFDAIYFGAVGWPDVPDHVSLWGLRLAICQGFDQYVCLRPVRLLPGIASPLRDAYPRAHRLRRRPREHRGRIRRRRRSNVGAGRMQRSPCRPRLHRARLRTDHPLRVRPGDDAPAARRSRASPRAMPSSTA